MNTSLTRRRFLVTAAAGTAGLALGGCAGPAVPGPGAPSGDPGAAFPVRVPGQLGTVTVPRRPERVVSVGQYRDTDAAVALGLVPLATPDLSGFISGGLAPWVVAELDGARPQLLDMRDGPPLERIAALRPDLILATDRASLREEYETLSAVAPTLSADAGYNSDPWQVTTRRVGTALGRADQAAALVASVTERIRAARAGHPGFEGRTFTVGPVQPDGAVTTVNSETDASAVFMSQLGLRLSPAVTSLPQGSLPGRAAVSSERLDVIDADVVILTYSTPEARRRTEAQPLFRSLAAVRRGAYVPVDLPVAIAMAFPTALSVPYALDRLVPQIADALSG